MDVRMPDGTVVRNVPEGTTRSEITRRLQLAGHSSVTAAEQQEMAARGITQSVGPTDMSGEEISRRQREEVSGIVKEGNQKIPMIERESFHDASIPVLGGMAGALVPGVGWGALLAQAGTAGLGAGGGELIRQDLAREQIDPAKAAKTGATNAALSFGVGAGLKGLGALAKKLFSTPLQPAQQAAAMFASAEGMPFPLSSAAPGSGAARVQGASGALLPGALRNQADATKVAQFLNQRVATMTDAARPVDEAAAAGQQFLRKVFEPGETAYKGVFSQFSDEAGELSAIPITNLKAAALQAANRLEARGQTTGGLYQRLRTIVKTNADAMTPGELDDLYGSVIKQAFNAKGAAGGEGKIVLGGIVDDMEAFIPGVKASMEKASGLRDEFRDLRKIPGLERLSKDFGTNGATKGTRHWLSEMFSNPDGKALAALREKNPQLYHDLADSWLASNLSQFRKSEGLMNYLDGPAFRTWFERNKNGLKVVLGGPQTEALDNFSLYASMMTGAQKVASKPMEITPMLARGLGESALIAKAPLLMLPTEGASFVIARGLSDPNSQLFKLFTKGFSPTTRFMTLQAGQAAGRASGKDSR